MDSLLKFLLKPLGLYCRVSDKEYRLYRRNHRNYRNCPLYVIKQRESFLGITYWRPIYSAYDLRSLLFAYNSIRSNRFSRAIPFFLQMEAIVAALEDDVVNSRKVWR